MAKAKAAKKSSETPLMQQYNKIKKKYPDAMLLFRVGDFYETFGEDAVKAAKILGIVQTQRKNGAASEIELAGFPHHSLNTYLPKLVRAGQRVAICDQLEDPKMTKKIVKRGVTELVTPGVSLNDEVLDQKKNNFLASVFLEKESVGVSFLDISTGEFLTAQGSFDYIDKLLQSFQPSEVLIQRNKQKEFYDQLGDKFLFFKMDDWVYAHDYAYEKLTGHFKTTSLKGFGIEKLNSGIIASGAILQYLQQTEHAELGHISSISRIEEDQYVWLDRFTIRNLELVNSPHADGVTLLDVLDHTLTPMGGRLLKRWTLLPLKNITEIKRRLSAVQHFVENTGQKTEFRDELKEINDLERLVSKVATLRVNPRELLQLKKSLLKIAPIKKMLLETKNDVLKKMGDQINLCELLVEKLEAELMEDAPVQLNKGSVIKNGVNKELDDLRSISFSGKDFLQKLQEKESERTGITSLKIAFNNVFGYYIEVRNTHKDKVPEDWIRKQTLVNAERYITEELKEYENKILGAEEKILQLETRLYQELVQSVSEYVLPIQNNAQLIAKLDTLLCFAEVAQTHKYCCPELNEDKKIDIKAGRHPVIEANLSPGESYIDNDVFLDTEQQQIMMITGPNMSGKSALLRQTALIVIMAQMGCFVPAAEAHIGWVDKVFTRVGASDNISSGESTFMVEMNETASILNNVSDRSLVLLDEIGRGTSTYDGISIAWSIAEYLHENPKAKAKTLFATHYHELNEMSTAFERIINYNVSVRETKDDIVFMRKLVQGGSNHSFGIHVAKMAGMPQRVLDRSKEVLKELEQTRGSDDRKVKKIAHKSVDNIQMSFFQLDDPVLVQLKEQIQNIDIDTLTPVEALMKLHEIKKLIGAE